jgi:Ca2+:H+ antiporter
MTQDQTTAGSGSSGSSNGAGGPSSGSFSALRRSDRLLIVGSVVLTLAAALTRGTGGTIAPFLISALALALLAGVVGRSVDQLSDRLGPGAIGALQSALGNLPELFVCTFALRKGLTTVVSAALIGSILGNLLLVLGLAFVVGGRRHGMLRFSELRARMIMSLLILSVAAMFVPSLAHYVGAAANNHEVALSRVTAVVLLAVFALSVPVSLRRDEGQGAEAEAGQDGDEDGDAQTPWTRAGESWLWLTRPPPPPWPGRCRSPW